MRREPRSGAPPTGNGERDDPRARSTCSSIPSSTRSLARPDLTDLETRLLSDLFAIVEEHAAEGGADIDRDRVEAAFVFACEHHADQRRKSGEDFIVHPVGVAKICAGMRLDTQTLCAALLHDTVEDTTASLEEVSRRSSARRSRRSSTASPSSPASRSSRATRRRPRTTAR